MVSTRIGLVTLAALLVGAGAVGQPSEKTCVRQIDIASVTRTYRLHVPKGLHQNAPSPLVLVFHGGGSTAAAMERLTRFSVLADREHFIVAYPEGLSNHWNDGRDPLVMGARDVDDVPFVAAVIDELVRDQGVDGKRVYATGFSNGAIFSHYLAARLSDRIAAIAAVAGGIAERFRPAFDLGRPVSVRIIQGTEDPLVPIGGGEVRGRRGRLLPTGEAVALWVRANGCAGPVRSVDLADVDPTDGCRVTSRTWSGGREGSEVIFDEIRGGGHTWPGGSQHLPRTLMGRACRDVDATELAWEFFKRHRKP
jgi:polyhydroxybutyrate depolymerase